ncbi:MAG: RHS repeat protein [Spirochaetaceae bacterium]|nr:RHS repeat protein [Spirochaetaceae bacterium]
MKEEYNLLQTYEIFLKIMYISLLKELYDKANRLTNSYMEGEFESKTAEQLTTSNFSYINRDLVGAKQELVKYEDLPEIIFDTSARSYVYKFSGTKEIRAIELYPKSKVHRVRERDVHIYVKKSNEDAWQEVRNWKFNKDEKNGKLSFVFKEAVSAGYVKVRSVWDDRNVENESIDDYSTFKGNANNLLRIWTLENTLTEEYSYDGNSNRIRKAENGSGFSYEYYKNTNGGNTAKVRYDGNWYYTYDANGNRTSRAKALISGVADKNKEYWTYEWDLWNRLVKVVQYNAPDNGECVEVSYEYDALNHRISRTSGTETTKYAYGRNGALAYQEKTKDGSVTKRSFAYLNNEIVGFTDKVGGEESVYYTVTDIQGSITEVYDGSSNLVWKSGYTAFGELAGEVVDLIDFDGMYTGCDYDSDTGLTYHWNRWRSEDGSAFISEDPARDGANWYGYAGQNPMVYTDPTGLAPYINGVYDGPYNPDYNPGVPVEGPKTNPNGMPQNQTPNITGQGAEEKCVESPNVKDTSAIINSIEPQEERNIELLWGAYRINNDKVEIILGFKIRGKEKEVTASLKKQAELEEKFGYDNILCYVTSGLNMYISDGVVTERFINTNLEKIIENNLDAENRIKDFNNYSMDLAKALGLEKYYSYIYPESNGFNQLFLSKEKFYQSKYKYGIGNYLKKGHAMNLNKNSKINNFDHYMLFRNTPFNDFWNPGVDNGEGNYILYNISPVESYSVR